MRSASRSIVDCWRTCEPYPSAWPDKHHGHAPLQFRKPLLYVSHIGREGSYFSANGLQVFQDQVVDVVAHRMILSRLLDDLTTLTDNFLVQLPGLRMAARASLVYLHGPTWVHGMSILLGFGGWL